MITQFFDWKNIAHLKYLWYVVWIYLVNLSITFGFSKQLRGSSSMPGQLFWQSAGFNVTPRKWWKNGGALSVGDTVPRGKVIRQFCYK